MEQKVTEQPVTSPVMSVEDAAAYIGVGRSHMYEMLRGPDPVISSFKLAGTRLRKILRADLDRFIDEQASRAKPGTKVDE